MPRSRIRNPSKLAATLGLESPGRILLVDAPVSLARLLLTARPAQSETSVVEARALSSAKQKFDVVLLWREDRVGSRSVLESVVKRLEPGGVLWVVTAMRKVMGPQTPAIHRLELADLSKGLDRYGLRNDRQARVTPWHVAYRFVRRESETGNP